MKRLVLVLLAMALTLPACGQPAPTPAAGTSNAALHLVVAVEGGLSVKRLGWSDYAPALFGMALRNGDLLRLDSGAQATVACADLTIAKATGGVASVPCKVKKPLLVYGGGLIVPTRAEPPAGIPMVLSPRKTKVLDAHPTLRWSAVAGASYNVSVRGSGLNWSATVAGKSELVYPNDAPALAPGGSYKVVVQGGGRSSDEETEAGLGFTVLKADEAQVVRDAEARVRGLGLGDSATRLLIANLYASQGLNAEAIAALEGLTATGMEPAPMRMLGDLYVRVSLNRPAEQAYLQALDLSQKINDIEGQAAAQSALGSIYESFGNKPEAVQRTQKAIEWYQKLGDSKTVKELQDRLAALQK
jgi:hypothetical protein